MSKIADSLYNIRLMEDLAGKKTAIHSLHPVVKLLVTFAYLLTVVSFDRYEISRLLPLAFYPVILLTLAELPLTPLLKRLLLVEPLIIGIGILNPIFDREVVLLGGWALSRGWITFFSIFIKSTLTLLAALLLIGTTGINRLALALRMVKVPKLFVLQILLTYRYISVLMEEVGRILAAYAFRAPGQKGVRREVWGSLAGQLILRTYERAERIYQAMCLRGFEGEYNTGVRQGITLSDVIFLVGWLLFFVAVKFIDIPEVIGFIVAEVAG